MARVKFQEIFTEKSLEEIQEIADEIITTIRLDEIQNLINEGNYKWQK